MISRFRSQFVACMLERLSSRGIVVMMAITNMLMIILTYFFWNAFSASATKDIMGEFSRNTLLIYMTISVILRTVIVTFGITWRVGDMITDGTIAGILTKPLFFIEYWMFQQISRLVFSLLTITIPLLLPILIIEPTLLSTDLNIFPFLLSALIGFYNSTILNVLMGLSGFWFERTSAFSQLNVVLYTLASGILVPLAIYPTLIKEIVNFLPYRTIIDIPLQILINGNISLIIIQMVWAVGLTIIYGVVFNKGIKRLEAVGV